MSDGAGPPDGGTGFDRVLAFSVPQNNARGRVVRLGPVLDTVLSAHDYPSPIRHLLAEALVLTAMMGTLTKEEKSQLTVQAQAEGGIVDLLVCDYRDGELRGYVRHDPERLGAIGSNPGLEALFGEGYLAITYDLVVSGDRYQGIVPLEGESISRACESYFERSEQVPTLMRVAIRNEGEHTVAGGLLVQHFPESEEGRERLHVKSDEPDPQWEHVAVLAGSTRHDELVDAELGLEQLIWRLFHQEAEVRVEPLGPLARGCRCTHEHYAQVLSSFGEEERTEMRDEDGFIPVDCAFCSKIFKIAV